MVDAGDELDRQRFVWAEPVEMARLLYTGLRALDAQKCTVILCPLPPADGVGEAIRDRLRKAARSETEETAPASR